MRFRRDRTESYLADRTWGWEMVSGQAKLLAALIYENSYKNRKAT